MKSEAEKLASCVRAYMDCVHNSSSKQEQELARTAMFLALALYDKARKRDKESE